MHFILTAYDWADIEEEAREAGVTAFVSKPLFMSELRAVLTKPVEMEEPGTPEIETILQGKHVLLVEDNELNQEIATAILEEAGMNGHIAKPIDVNILMETLSEIFQ